MPFDIPGYDPQSVKLFSKSAKNQASKSNTKKRPCSSKSSVRNSSIMHFTLKEKNKNKSYVCPFDMLQSRDQREKKHQPQLTPAVGQYNPKTITKPKLTWDILKAYHQKNKHITRKQQDDDDKLEQSNQLDDSTLKNQSKLKQTETIQHLMSDFSVNLLRTSQQKTSKKYISLLNNDQNYNSLNNNSQIHYKNEKSNHKFSRKNHLHDNRRYQTVKSQVDMSRMTGRDGQNIKTLTSGDSITELAVDLNRSIDAIKNKGLINIKFSNQISREKANISYKLSANHSDYTYNYAIIKPKNIMTTQFSKTKGRYQNRQKAYLSKAYSYAHYDYDEYVWSGESKIFPNTKTSVIDFDKSKGR